MSNRLLAGRYELVEKIGEGGMAVVYKGKDRLLNRYVAIKILRPEYTKDEQFIENFRRESQAAAGLSHPNIVGVYDVGKEGNIYFIVMELIEGKVLSQIIKEKGRLEYKEAIHIIRQVASALSLAHKNQIVHRDVKPHNILITSTGVAKLADFGIAKAVSASTIVGGKNKVMGYVHYFSPEQARGAYVDERSDIYSLGVVLYEMLTGKVPFDGDNAVSIALMHINEKIPSVTSEVHGMPPQLEKIIEKATEKYQSNRYKQVDEMISDLDDIEFITKVMGKKAFIDEGVAVDIKEEKKTVTEPDTAAEAAVYKERRKPAKTDRTSSEKKSSAGNRKMTMFIVAGILILAIAGVFGLGSMMGWFGTDAEEIELPDFKGMTIEEALEQAASLGLKLEKDQDVYSPDQEEGKITSQTPTEGSTVMAGQLIKVNVSLGKRNGVVPKLEGMDIKEAIECAESFGFTVTPTVIESHFPKDMVISQYPGVGDVAKSGSEIKLEVSDGKGKEKVKVPDLFGRTPDEARALLSQAGLATTGNVTYEEVADMAANLIFWQSVAANTEVEKGSTVDYKVSKGTRPEGSGSGDADLDLDVNTGVGNEGNMDTQGGYQSSQGNGSNTGTE
ncbi:MAG: Stk1 family PASTA domain-containing Ser/Thr kinase [Firmicutes bacterium]|nr:Stk1 family PASTA domain-containing Ser/Thr kinase [Bacillota bacterium]